MTLRNAVTVSLFCLAALSGAGCRDKQAATVVPLDEARQLLLDRNWIDRLPDNAHDRLHVFRFVPSMGGGVYQDRTLFAGQFELFTFDHDGQTIRFHLHHTGEERSARYTIERLPVGSDSPLELHLRIPDSPRGPQDYYSLRSAHAAAGHDLDQEVRDLISQAKAR